jgi:hypothetical protein
MPSDPAPVIGDPIRFFLDRNGVRKRGWPVRLVRDALGEPDGTRNVGGYDKYYYRLDRVMNLEQESVEVAAAVTRMRRRRTARTSAADAGPSTSQALTPPLLALTRGQLLARGWTDGLVSQFLKPPDAYRSGREEGSMDPLYAAARVEVIEATPDFLRALAPIQHQRAQAAARRGAQAAAERQRLAAKEARERANEARARLKEEALRASFPGFGVTARVFNSGRGGEFSIGCIAAAVYDDEFCALVRAAEETGDWSPVVEWMLERPNVGGPFFRAALKFLAAKDSDGFRRWRVHEAPALWPQEKNYHKARTGHGHPPRWLRDARLAAAAARQPVPVA